MLSRLASLAAEQPFFPPFVAHPTPPSDPRGTSAGSLSSDRDHHESTEIFSAGSSFKSGGKGSDGHAVLCALLDVKRKVLPHAAILKRRATKIGIIDYILDVLVMDDQFCGSGIDGKSGIEGKSGLKAWGPRNDATKRWAQETADLLQFDVAVHPICHPFLLLSQMPSTPKPPTYSSSESNLAPGLVRGGNEVWEADVDGDSRRKSNGGILSGLEGFGRVMGLNGSGGSESGKAGDAGGDDAGAAIENGGKYSAGEEEEEGQHRHGLSVVFECGSAQGLRTLARVATTVKVLPGKRGLFSEEEQCTQVAFQPFAPTLAHAVTVNFLVQGAHGMTSKSQDYRRHVRYPFTGGPLIEVGMFDGMNDVFETEHSYAREPDHIFKPLTVLVTAHAYFVPDASACIDYHFFDLENMDVVVQTLVSIPCTRTSPSSKLAVKVTADFQSKVHDLQFTESEGTTGARVGGFVRGLFNPAAPAPAVPKALPVPRSKVAGFFKTAKK